MKPALSLCLVVKNEVKFLPLAIKSVRKIVDEIIVIDTGSADKTVQLAKRLGARVFSYTWSRGEGEAREQYLKHATGDWILVLDADEIIAKKDLPGIQKLIQTGQYQAYSFLCRNYVKQQGFTFDWHANNKKYPHEEKFSQCPGWTETRVYRLFKRRAGFSYEKGPGHHANLLESFKKKKTQVGEANIVIHHLDHLKGGENLARGKNKERLKGILGRAREFPNALTLLRAGEICFMQGHDVRAERYLKKAIKYESQNERILKVLTALYLEKKQYSKSVPILKRLRLMNPKAPDILFLQGLYGYETGQCKAALKSYQKALEQQPNHLMSLNGLGIIYQRLGQLKKAEKCFAKAIQIHPEFEDAIFNLALFYLNSGQKRRAIRYFKKVLKLNPADSEVRHWIKVAS